MRWHSLRNVSNRPIPSVKPAILRLVLYLRKSRWRWLFRRNGRREDCPNRVLNKQQKQWNRFLVHVSLQVPDVWLSVCWRWKCLKNVLHTILPNYGSIGCVQRHCPEVGIPVSCSANDGKEPRISIGHSRVGTPSGRPCGMRGFLPSRSVCWI